MSPPSSISGIFQYLWRSAPYSLVRESTDYLGRGTEKSCACAIAGICSSRIFQGMKIRRLNKARLGRRENNMTQITSIKLGVIVMCVATVPLSLAQTPRIGTSGSKQTGATQIGTNARSGTNTGVNTNVGAHIGTNAGAQTGIINQAVGITGAAAGLSGSSATSTGATQTGANAHSSLRPLPSAEISRRRGSPPRRYHRPRSPQLQLRPRRKCSDPPLAANSSRKDARMQRRARVMALVRRSSRPPGMPDAFDRAPLR